MAAKTPRLPDETDANYIRRVKANTWKATSGASTLRTEVHDAIEQRVSWRKISLRYYRLRDCENM